MALNTMADLENQLSLDNFKWLENIDDNRSKFLKYSIDELKNIQTDAIAQWEFEIAAFIRDVLKDKEDQSEEEKESETEKESEQMNNSIENIQSQLADTIAPKETTETDVDETNLEDNDSLVQTNWEYVKLWREQKDIANEITEYFEQKGITHKDWGKIYIIPETVEFDGDLIHVNYIRNHYFFKKENWQLKEIPLIPDKMIGNCKIRYVSKVWDYYRVELCFLDENWRVKKDEKWWDIASYYYIDKDGKYIPELWVQTGKDNFYVNRFLCYEYNQKKWEDKMLRTIFNKNMEKIAEFEDMPEESKRNYNIKYCDDDTCICYDRKDPQNPEYVIFDKTGIVWRWTEDSLKWNEYMQRFLKIVEDEKQLQAEHEAERKRINSIPMEERFMDINHCKIVYDNDDKTAISILNDKWDVLYKLWNIETVSYNYDTPYIHTKQWDNIEIKDWNRKDNVLFIQIRNYTQNTTKSIFINKTTWEKKEFEWFRWEYSFREWKLIKVFFTGDKAEVFDDELNYLWVYDIDQRDVWFPSVKKEENWVTKYYIVSETTGKILTEYERHPIGWNRACFNRYEKNWKTYLIVFVPGKWLAQVEL